MNKSSQFGKNVLLVSVVGILLLTFACHVRYSQKNIKMDDLMRIEAVAPSAASRDVIRTVKKAVVHDMNYLNQVFFYSLYKGKTIYQVGKFRIWDGLFAVFAVLMIYRVGSMCSSKMTGVLSAVALALTPPELWGKYALEIFVVLLNFELLITAISRNTIWRWGLWSLSTVFLFSTGVFAEALLLQSWFLSIVIIYVLWLIGIRILPEWKFFARLVRESKRRKTKSLWKKVQGDAGFSRYIATAIFVGIIILALSFVGGFFVSRSILSVETLALIILLSFGLIIIASAVMLALPIFHRERNIILDWLSDYKLNKTSKMACEIFTTLKSGTLLKIFFSYSAAILFFLPFFFAFYKGINIFIDNWEVSKTFDFVNNSGSFYTWGLLALPVIFLLMTVICYMFKIVSRGRLIGAVSLMILSSIYIFQQRYAVISTPFYIICSAGIVAIIIDIFSFLFIKNENA